MSAIRMISGSSLVRKDFNKSALLFQPLTFWNLIFRLRAAFELGFGGCSVHPYLPFQLIWPFPQVGWVKCRQGCQGVE